MKTSYRRRAILNRIQSALDAFYLLQRIDWKYDMRNTLDEILAIAMREIELGEGRSIERGLIIIRTSEDGTLEVHAGWRVDDVDLSFSRTVVQQTFEKGLPILCENAKEDPRFQEAESLKALSTLSLVCVPIQLESRLIGALYIESHSPSDLFNSEDLEFLREFAGTIAPYLKTALLHQEHMREICKLRSEIDSLRRGFDGIVGRSRAMQQVFDMVRVAASVDDTALITGESGCGKELVARAIHEASPRSRGPLLVVDCSGLAEHLLESELFGHIAGAFTGATGPKAGAFEAADGGTVFLDEISDAPLALQQMLRRVLQEGEIRRVGDTKVRKVDVRVICATNKDLPGLVKSGSFLPDLYHRINLVPIRVPPLRDRREDIPDLVRHFLEKSAREASAAAAPALTQAALDLLVASEWKENNIRELRNVVKLSAMLARGKLIDSETIENVLRIQRGEAPRLAAGADRAGPGLAPAPNGPGDPPPHCAHLVQIHREAFQDLLRTQRAGDDDDEGEEDASAAAAPKRTAPFYLLQLELATRAIVEGLRACRWKLRPAARLLGISPMKLRGTLKESLAGILARHGGDLNAAAASLDIPLEVLERKAGDLGLEDLRQ